MDQAITTIKIEDVAKKLVLVGVDVRCVSGTVSCEDRRISSDDKDVFTPGSVRYISPITLRPMAAARQAAARACRTRGTRFWGAWAVAEEEVPALLAELEKVAAFVKVKKESIVSSWTSELTRWEEIHPVAANYRSQFPTRDYAEKAIGIAVSAVRITPTPALVIGADDAIEHEVLGMPQRILEEIANDVRDTWKPGAQKATQAIKGLLNRILNKCQTLSFVGGNLADVALFVAEAIKRLPQTGEIAGNDYLLLSGILSLLERPDVMNAGAFSIQMVEEKQKRNEVVASIAPAEPIQTTEESPAPESVAIESNIAKAEIITAPAIETPCNSVAPVVVPMEIKPPVIPACATNAPNPATSW